MKRFRDLCMIVIFFCFLAVTAVMLVLLPKADKSINEKRTLAKIPVFTVESVLNGKYEKSTEDYITDHFPFRDMWVAFNSYSMLYMGRNGVSGVYKGEDGYLINEPVKYNSKIIDRNIEAMNELTEKTGIQSSLIIVPSTGYIMKDKLPKNHLEYQDGQIIDYIKKLSESTIGWIDIEKVFEEKKDETQLFYKTDHHWTTAGAYCAYVEYCRNIGFEPMWDFDIARYSGFYGTTYSKSALWHEKGENIEIWEYPIDVNVTIDNEETSNSMYYKEHLKEADKYPIFLDGNHGYEKIVNKSNPDGEKLLVIKDSYAHCLVPFLINHYSEIDMIDTRYYMDSVSSLTEENKFDRILYIFGISSVCEANDISILE